MTDLGNPTLENEETSDNPHAGCGPAAAASIVNDAHGPGTTTVSAENDWLIATHGPTGGGVPISWVGDCLSRWAIPSRLRVEPLAVVQRSSTDAKHETVIWHQCDGYARPVTLGATEESHYRAGYGYLNTMNPWGGVLSNDNCAIGDMGTHLEVMMVLPKDGGDDVAISADLKNGLAVLASIALLGRQRPKDDPLAAGNLGPNGEGYVELLQSIVSDPAGESNSYLATLHAIAGISAALEALTAKVDAMQPGGVTMDQVKAEIVQALKAGEAGV